MTFDDTTLQAIIDCKPQGDFGPFAASDEEAAENYACQLRAAIAASNQFAVYQQADEYGSGYASFFDLFISKQPLQTALADGENRDVDGISLYINRLAPIAVFGPQQVAVKQSWPGTIQGWRGHVPVSQLNQLPSGDWREELATINYWLQQYGYTLLDPTTAQQPLSFSAADVGYEWNLFGTATVYDALFYWVD
ncbi:hypothetical protein [Shewanella sp.]|uniref:hypothetical protein n=1 Tax=Shewanella sp. TaxID=50422 RepID=UPI003A97DDE1